MDLALQDLVSDNANAPLGNRSRFGDMLRDPTESGKVVRALEATPDLFGVGGKPGLASYKGLRPDMPPSVKGRLSALSGIRSFRNSLPGNLQSPLPPAARTRATGAELLAGLFNGVPSRNIIPPGVGAYAGSSLYNNYGR